MKDPAFLFYSADFQIGTEDMTNEQVGCYIRLMCRQHLKGHISEEHMLKICKTYDTAVMDKFKVDENGLYYNERLESEIIKRKRYSESRANNRRGKKPNPPPPSPPKSEPKPKYKKFIGIEILHTNLTEKDYQKLITKYGEEKTLLAIEEFDIWLGKGTPNAKKYIGKNHYSHFRSDSWTWPKADERLKEKRGKLVNYGV